MRILVSGALGQDGSILSDILIGRGHDVWGTTHTEISTSIYNPRLLVLPAKSPEDYSQILDDLKPELVFHFAAKHVSSEHKEIISKDIRKEMYECHFGITKSILDWQAHNKDSKSLIALSSQMYSPTQMNTLISSKSFFSPSSYYGETKMFAFELMREYRKKFGVKTYGAILFNHTSIRNKASFLFPRLAREVSNLVRGFSSAITINDSNALVDICHASEVCNGVIQLINYSEPVDLVFSSGKLVPIADVVSDALQMFNYNKPFQLKSRGESGRPRYYLVGDNREAFTLISWKAEMSPAEILAEQVQTHLIQ